MSELDKLIESVEAGDDLPEIGHGYWQFLPAGACILAARTYHEGSLDTALALHEALLPGWHWSMDDGGGQEGAFCCVSHPSTDEVYDADEAETPARAWLQAILRAYRSVQA